MKIFLDNFVKFDLKYCRLLLIEALPGCIGIPIVTHQLSENYMHIVAHRDIPNYPGNISFLLAKAFPYILISS